MAIPISNLGRFKLETDFKDSYVVHTTYDSEYSQKEPTKSSMWVEEKQIGSGAFGCERGPGGQLRAVRGLLRDFMAGYSQELLGCLNTWIERVSQMHRYCV